MAIIKRQKQKTMKEKLELLSDEQREVAEYLEGNARVIAGAGSGKTFTVITRIENIVDKDKAKPEETLMVTYTNTGANEMKARLNSKIKNKVNVSTIHSLAYKEMRNFPKYKTKKLLLNDSWKSKTLIALCNKNTYSNKIGLGLTDSTGLSHNDIRIFIESQKNNGITYSDKDKYCNTKDIECFINKQFQYKIYKIYEDLRDKERVIHFEDIVIDFYRKLRDDEGFRKRMQNKYKYIIVDEAQDTSVVQYKILQLMNTGNTMIVGDFRQSIYGSFAYAGFDEFLEFDKLIPDVKDFELTNNYRSYKHIVDCANDLIRSTKDKVKIEQFSKYKDCISVKGENDTNKVNIKTVTDNEEQLAEICDLINSKISHGYKYKDISILYRTNLETMDFEVGFRRKNIPFKIHSDRSFYDRMEIKLLLDYCYSLADNTDDANVKSALINFNPYLGKEAVDRLENLCYSNHLNILEGIRNFNSIKDEYFTNGKGKGKVRIIKDFRAFLKKLDLMSAKSGLGGVLKVVRRDTAYMDRVNFISRTDEVLNNRKQSSNKFIDYCSKFKSMEDLIKNIDYLKAEAIRNKDLEKDAVQLMSIHKSKGLENKIVIIPNVYEGNIPHKNSIDEGFVEEERRILYVGITRAEEDIYLFYPVLASKSKIKEREKGNSQSDGQVKHRSRFLDDILGEQDRNIQDLKRMDIIHSMGIEILK